MAIAVAAIRTAVAEVLEGSLGTVHPVAGAFKRGAFEGQPDDAKLAKLRQVSTATHWFDVVVGEHGTHEASPISSLATREIKALPITVRIYSGTAPEAQQAERTLLLANIASDCADAVVALGYPGALTATVAATATGIVGGLMRSASHDGLAEFNVTAERWDRGWIESQIDGAVIVAETA